MRKLSRAICTSGEPVSPSVVAYSAMIFFLVSASVPIDMRGSSRFSLRGAPGPVHPGTGIRGRYTASSSPMGQPGKTISAPAERLNRGARPRSPHPRVPTAWTSSRGRPARAGAEPIAARDVGRLGGRAGPTGRSSLGAVADGVRQLDDPRDDRTRRCGPRRRRRSGRRHGPRRDAAARQPARGRRRSSSSTPTTGAAASGPPCSTRSSSGPRGRAHGADGRAVLARRPPRPRRGVPDGPRLRARHRGDLRRSATSRRPRASGPRWQPRHRPTTTATASRPWQGRVPDPLVEGYCLLAEAFVDEAPMGDLDYEREVWTAERVRKRDDHFVATGRHQFGVLAYAPDGSCAATTELFVNEAADWRALQGGTLVQPGPSRSPARAGPQAGQPARPRGTASPLPLRLHRHRRGQRRHERRQRPARIPRRGADGGDAATPLGRCHSGRRPST